MLITDPPPVNYSILFQSADIDARFQRDHVQFSTWYLLGTYCFSRVACFMLEMKTKYNLHVCFPLTNYFKAMKHNTCHAPCFLYIKFLIVSAECWVLICPLQLCHL